MRFMMFMIPAVYQQNTPADFRPDPAAIEQMGKYNDKLRQAGVLLSLDGLHPPVSGARVSFAGAKPKVTDGPFAESKEVVGGYWLIDVKSREEAIDWATRCPAEPGDMIEVRQIFDLE
jgi:hypothetical protein